jgi:hypothetical protein
MRAIQRVIKCGRSPREICEVAHRDTRSSLVVGRNAPGNMGEKQRHISYCVLCTFDPTYVLQTTQWTAWQEALPSWTENEPGTYSLYDRSPYERKRYGFHVSSISPAKSRRNMT